MVDSTLVRVGEAAKELLNLAGTEDARLPTGFSIDDLCGKVGPGELALLWARSGAGKSTWALNIIANTPQVPTIFFSMEMGTGSLTEWLATMSFPMPVGPREVERVIRAGENHPHYAEVSVALDGVSDAYPNVVLSQLSRPSVAVLDEKCKAMTREMGVRPSRVFIDHLELLEGAGDYTGVKQVAGDLHSWALELGIAVFCLQQTGRGSSQGNAGNDGHHPVRLSSGVYGGEADADWVFGLYRPDKDPEFKKTSDSFRTHAEYVRMTERKNKAQNKAVLQVVKNRPFGDLLEDGTELRYNPYNRRLTEPGEDVFNQ